MRNDEEHMRISDTKREEGGWWMEECRVGGQPTGRRHGSVSHGEVAMGYKEEGDEQGEKVLR